MTIAEGYLFTGEIALGLEAARKALRAAEDTHLPQQVARVCKILSKYRTKSGDLGDLFESARRARAKLPIFVL
ncbi:MAG: hypothetical protein ACRD1C_11880 [Terriglobales bacterium]